MQGIWKSGSAWLVAALLVSSGAESDSFVFVGNSRNEVPNLSKLEVRKLFTGQAKQWRSGRVFQGVIGEPNSAELGWLAATIFGVSSKDLLTRIKQEIFRGEMKRPIVVKSSEECIEVVEKNEAALCVATEASAKTLPAGVIVIALTD
jgi:hypothetical protein